MGRTIYLVRHTRPEVGQGICYGQTDVDVCASFEEEAGRIKETLRDFDFDCLYTSPLKRCQKLASILGQNAIVDHRLMEMNFGEWEGQHWNDIYLTMEGKHWFSDFLNHRCPQGESFGDLLARIASFMTEVENKESRNILIVTHAGVVRAILVYLRLIVADEAFDLSLDFGQTIRIENNQYQIIL